MDITDLKTKYKHCLSCDIFATWSQNLSANRQRPRLISPSVLKFHLHTLFFAFQVLDGWTGGLSLYLKGNSDVSVR